MAVLAKIGSPEDPTLRRPDLAALDRAMMRKQSIRPAAAFELRQARLHYERACLMATLAIQLFPAQGGGCDSGDFAHGDKSLEGAA